MGTYRHSVLSYSFLPPDGSPLHVCTGTGTAPCTFAPDCVVPACALPPWAGHPRFMSTSRSRASPGASSATPLPPPTLRHLIGAEPKRSFNFRSFGSDCRGVLACSVSLAAAGVARRALSVRSIRSHRLSARSRRTARSRSARTTSQRCRSHTNRRMGLIRIWNPFLHAVCRSHSFRALLASWAVACLHEPPSGVNEAGGGAGACGWTRT